jgi:hypothetical protein
MVKISVVILIFIFVIVFIILPLTIFVLYEYSCLLKTCPANTTCNRGQCVPSPVPSPVPTPSPGPTPTPSPESKCPGTPICSNRGQCVNSNCICSVGFTGADCSKIIPTPDPCKDVKCSDGQVCINGTCTSDLCFNVKCPSNQFCSQGICFQSSTCIDFNQCKKFIGYLQTVSNNQFFGIADNDNFGSYKSKWTFEFIEIPNSKDLQCSSILIDNKSFVCNAIGCSIYVLGPSDWYDPINLTKNTDGTYSFYFSSSLGNKNYVQLAPGNGLLPSSTNSIASKFVLIPDEQQCNFVTCPSNQVCSQTTSLCQDLISVPQYLIFSSVSDKQFLSPQSNPLGIVNSSNNSNSTWYLKLNQTTINNINLSYLENFILNNQLSLSCDGNKCIAINSQSNDFCNGDTIFISYNADNTVSFFTLLFGQRRYISFSSSDYKNENNQWSTIQKSSLDTTTKLNAFVTQSNIPTLPTCKVSPSGRNTFRGYLKNKYISQQKNADYYIGWTEFDSPPVILNQPGENFNLTNLEGKNQDLNTSGTLWTFSVSSFASNGDFILDNKVLQFIQIFGANNTSLQNGYTDGFVFTLQPNPQYLLRRSLYMTKNSDNTYSLYFTDIFGVTSYYIQFDLFQSSSDFNNASVAKYTSTNDEKCKFFLE